MFISHRDSLRVRDTLRHGQKKKVTQIKETGDVYPGDVEREHPCEEILLCLDRKKRHKVLGRSQEGRIHLSGRQCFLTIMALRWLVVKSLAEDSSQNGKTEECGGMMQEQRIQEPSIKGLECVVSKEQRVEH